MHLDRPGVFNSTADTFHLAESGTLGSFTQSVCTLGGCWSSQQHSRCIVLKGSWNSMEGTRRIGRPGMLRATAAGLRLRHFNSTKSAGLPAHNECPAVSPLGIKGHASGRRQI